MLFAMFFRCQQRPKRCMIVPSSGVKSSKDGEKRHFRPDRIKNPPLQVIMLRTSLSGECTSWRFLIDMPGSIAEAQDLAAGRADQQPMPCGDQPIEHWRAVEAKLGLGPAVVR